MTYQNLLNEFIKTDKRFLEYEQGNHFVRLVKIQLKPGVYALYATITYCGKDPSYNRYHFNPRDAMELVGYIDHNGDLRFPTRHFSGIIEDAENGPQHENKKNVLESILQKEAKKMALATPLSVDFRRERRGAAYSIRRSAAMGIQRRDLQQRVPHQRL